jgi:acyl dehydratase
MAMTSTVLHYGDVKVGDEVPRQAVDLTIPVMMRWCAAAEIFRPDHYDYQFAVNQLKLPQPVGSGWWTQARLYKLLHDWVGDSGWVLRVRHEIRSHIFPQVLTFAGTVTGTSVKDGLGYVEVNIAMRQHDGFAPVTGNATVVLPLRGGRPVPYPFPPVALSR